MCSENKRVLQSVINLIAILTQKYLKMYIEMQQSLIKLGKCLKIFLQVPP